MFIKTKILKLICSFLMLILLCLTAKGLQKESTHFIFNYEPQDSSVVDTLASTLESGYEKVTSDLWIKFSYKIKVNIYPTLQEFHNAVFWPNAPDWVIGIGTSEIFIVSPLNPGPAHRYSDFFEYVMVHEFTHVCTNGINPYLPTWLGEGFSCYEGGPYTTKSFIANAYTRLGRFPTIDELNSDINTFVNLNGYEFSLTLNTFLIETYGLEVMRKFIHNPNDFSVFSGLSKIQIQQNWHDYLLSDYINCTDLEASSVLNYVSSYPNPFKAKFFIKYELKQKSDVRLIITDIQGKIVKQVFFVNKPSGIYTEDLDGKNLADGIYFYNVNTGKSIIFGKLIKQ